MTILIGMGLRLLLCLALLEMRDTPGGSRATGTRGMYVYIGSLWNIGWNVDDAVMETEALEHGQYSY